MSEYLIIHICFMKTKDLNIHLILQNVKDLQIYICVQTFRKIKDLKKCACNCLITSPVHCDVSSTFW